MDADASSSARSLEEKQDEYLSAADAHALLEIAAKHRIVEKHHGKFEVHSEHGKGTTFRVWLPVKQADGVVPA